MNVTLAPSLQKFIERKIEQRAYASADEVIAASLALLPRLTDELRRPVETVIGLCI